MDVFERIQGIDYSMNCMLVIFILFECVGITHTAFSIPYHALIMCCKWQDGYGDTLCTINIRASPTTLLD